MLQKTYAQRDESGEMEGSWRTAHDGGVGKVLIRISPPAVIDELHRGVLAYVHVHTEMGRPGRGERRAGEPRYLQEPRESIYTRPPGKAVVRVDQGFLDGWMVTLDKILTKQKQNMGIFRRGPGFHLSKVTN